MDLGSLDAGRVEEILSCHGAVSVTLTDAGDKPVLEPAPGETPLWNDTRIAGLFRADTDIDALVDDLQATFELAALPAHAIEQLADREWGREWLKDFGPMRFGRRLWVLPGDAEADGVDAVAVRLDPGLAFGSGTHATTAMCLEWLDGIDLSGKSVLDYGSGSGILAIAALKLGAASAVAMDIDPQAVSATRQNAERNGIDTNGPLRVVGSDAEIQGSYDVLVANILAGPLKNLEKSLTTRLSSGGKMALSGILSDQVDAVRAAYATQIAFDPPAFREQGKQTWARLSGKRR